ncbi:DNA polymerase III subunit chi [Candidatus Methylobacter oryzae]|uniref:DNA polymerase III subunit chi n=1 Tax=Candidatus Methylobacter oryzae TaxID=2497749 RepID=A0ABY3CBX0_9GAMM|nr:DNA polymerase III subunit chi [Candidatus Methylobacter oryzae]TRW97126.1 DNA polymerase III subunit chi [Candidatus Methylobacter oryzae]
MVEVSFYILPSESLQDRHLFACKLIEKAYRSGSFCYVLTDSDEQSRILDDLLWTFRAGSFIPHQTYIGEPPDIEKTVLIGSLDAPGDWQKVVFNLSSRYPNIGPQTGRILEILDNSETTKEAGRKRYRQYQQSGVKITTYKDW